MIKEVKNYIESYDLDTREKLTEFHNIVKTIAPGSTESISYGMPTYKVNGQVLTHFAAFKSHIGMYPIPTTIAAFQKDLKEYHTSKGGIQFPKDQDLPVKLIKKILEYRLENIK